MFLLSGGFSGMFFIHIWFYLSYGDTSLFCFERVLDAVFAILAIVSSVLFETSLIHKPEYYFSMSLSLFRGLWHFLFVIQRYRDLKGFLEWNIAWLSEFLYIRRFCLILPVSVHVVLCNLARCHIGCGKRLLVGRCCRVIWEFYSFRWTHLVDIWAIQNIKVSCHYDWEFGCDV